MKHLFSKAAIAVLAVAGMASCSNESDFQIQGEKSEATAMRFSLGQRNATRGIPTTSTNFLDRIASFRVWAYYAEGATGEGVVEGGRYVGASDTEGVLIDNKTNGAWDYHNPLDQQYWPATTAPLNFQAITPESDASFTLKNTISDCLSHLTAEVAIPTTTADQKDIMFAKADNQTRETNAQCVALTFKHGLSQVVFKARLASEKITAIVNSIQINDVHSKGQVGFFGQDAALTSSVTTDDYATYTVGLNDATTLTTAATVNLTADNGALLMLPQTVPAWSTSATNNVPLSTAILNKEGYLTVNCKIVDNTSGTVLISNEDVYIPFAIDWQQGKKYTYTLVFGALANGYDEAGKPLENMLPISYSVNAEDWTEVDGGEKGIGGKIQ